MRVIAIDPGYGRCGVAVIERQKGKNVLLYSSCITTKTTTPLPDRLLAVVKEVSRLLDIHTPSAFALERLYFNTNQKTAMGVAEVRGALIYIARSAGVPVFEYTPPQVKAAVAGWGRADKKQLMRMIPQLVRIEKNITSDDEFDAIAVGITHLAHSR